jgi:hypothetical protein
VSALFLGLLVGSASAHPIALPLDGTIAKDGAPVQGGVGLDITIVGPESDVCTGQGITFLNDGAFQWHIAGPAYMTCLRSELLDATSHRVRVHLSNVGGQPVDVTFTTTAPFNSTGPFALTCHEQTVLREGPYELAIGCKAASADGADPRLVPPAVGAEPGANPADQGDAP